MDHLGIKARSNTDWKGRREYLSGNSQSSAVSKRNGMGQPRLAVVSGNSQSSAASRRNSMGQPRLAILSGNSQSSVASRRNSMGQPRLVILPGNSQSSAVSKRNSMGQPRLAIVCICAKKSFTKLAAVYGGVRRILCSDAEWHHMGTNSIYMGNCLSAIFPISSSFMIIYNMLL